MSRLCFTFQNIADRTWRAIADAHQAGLSYGEETITETNLLQLKRYHPKQIRIRAFSKREESKTGADWEWWIGGHGRWLGMRVQAKRIKYPYDSFDRLQTYKTNGEYNKQIDILIDKAKMENLNPVYCLYVSSQTPPPLRATTRFCRYRRRFYMGCLIGDAVAVRSTGSNKLNDLAHVCHPWHCLVCDCSYCPSAEGPPYGGYLADAAFALLKKSRDAGMEYRAEGLEGYADFPLFEPQQRLPDYLELIDARGGSPDEKLRKIAAERDLAGFVIIGERD